MFVVIPIRVHKPLRLAIQQRVKFILRKRSSYKVVDKIQYNGPILESAEKTVSIHFKYEHAFRIEKYYLMSKTAKGGKPNDIRSSTNPFVLVSTFFAASRHDFPV